MAPLRHVPWVAVVLLITGSFSSLAINQEQYPVEQEVKLPSLPSKQESSPCQKPKNMAGDVKMHLMMPSKVKVTSNEVIGRSNYQQPIRDNCTEDGDGTVVEPVQYDHWKLHIIMACTVTAAVEVVLIIFIVLYWRQIRWTLRKITCPCGNCHNNSRHEEMGRDEEDEEETNDLDTVELGSRSPGRGSREHRVSQSSSNHRREGRLSQSSSSIQTYTAPRRSRVQTATEYRDVAVPGPSGTGGTTKPSPSSFKMVVHHYTSSDESLSGDNIATGDHVSGHVTMKQVSPIKGLSRSRVKGSKGKKDTEKILSAEEIITNNSTTIQSLSDSLTNNSTNIPSLCDSLTLRPRSSVAVDGSDYTPSVSSSSSEASVEHTTDIEQHINSPSPRPAGDSQRPAGDSHRPAGDSHRPAGPCNFSAIITPLIDQTSHNVDINKDGEDTGSYVAIHPPTNQLSASQGQQVQVVADVHR